MTIGIAISGPSAGLAAFRALRAVEAVGRGAIGGFVSFVAIDAAGALSCAGTQRGGTATLFAGAPPPQHMAEAPLAALMSSGPDRPEPVSQFTPADESAGLLTGHRLPNMPCAGGKPPNLIALDHLRDGASPETAVAEALARDPTADAGLIAMDLSGRIALGNTDAVSRRDDLGQALYEDESSGLRIGVLHNCIFPHQPLSTVAVSAALDAIAPLDRVAAEASLIGLRMVPGDQRCLVLDETGSPQMIVTPDAACFGPRWEGSAVWRGDPVLMDGTVVGLVSREVYCIARNGCIESGRGGVHVGWRASPDAPASVSTVGV